MAVDGGIGEPLKKVSDEFPQRLFLLRSTGVFRSFAIRSNTTYVAHANRISVLPRTMSADLWNWSAPFDRAITIHDSMITDSRESTLTMPSVNIFNSEILAFGSSRTVNNYFVNAARTRFYDRPCFRADDTIDSEAVFLLEYLDCFFGDWAEDAIGGQGECFLKCPDFLAPASEFKCWHQTGILWMIIRDSRTVWRARMWPIWISMRLCSSSEIREKRAVSLTKFSRFLRWRRLRAWCSARRSSNGFMGDWFLSGDV